MIQIQKLFLVSIYFINTFYNGSKIRKQYIKYDGLIFVGTVTAGMGISHLNKFLAAMNIAPMHWKTFKNHEKEVGACAEKMSLESCKQAIF